jgi:hypothetical protein
MSQSQGIGVRPSRRTIAKGAAWAAPVIAVGAAAPAFAASPNDCVPVFSFANDSCKCPGQSTDSAWGYYLSICVSESSGCTDGTGAATVVLIDQLENNSKKVLLPATKQLPLTVTVGDCTETLLFLSTSSSSSIRFHYSVDGGATFQWSSYIDAPPDCDTSGKGQDTQCLPPASFGG